MSRDTSRDPAAPGNSVISDEQLSLLRDDFARLDAFWPCLADSIIEYVVNGQGQEVLDRLVAMPGRGRALDLAGCSHSPGVNRAARARFFASPPAADPSFFLRLARVYDALAWPDRIDDSEYPDPGPPALDRPLSLGSDQPIALSLFACRTKNPFPRRSRGANAPRGR